MTALEIVLVIIGIIFFLGSFLVTEKLSSRDLKQLSSLSETEISTMIERELKKADSKITDAVDGTIEDSVSKVQRQMDKEANEKMMAINEYSDTVMESIQKSHNEVMFLYSMLNDKHEELTSLVGELKNLEAETKQVLSSRDNKIEEEHLPLQESDLTLIQESRETFDMENHNERILDLYKKGKSQIEIAKELELGLGEVRLVIDLYQGE